MRSAAKTAALMAALTLGTKVLGFLREVLLAGFFGTGLITDAYVMAGAIPGILFAGVFTAMSVSYMPLFSHLMEEEGAGSGNRFTSQALVLSTGIALVCSLLGILFADQLVALFAPGYDGPTAALTAFYLRVTFFYIVFHAAAGLLESYLQYRGSFLKPLLAGYLQSACVLAVILLGAFYDVRLLSAGLLVGSVFRFAFLAASARGKGFRFRPGNRMGQAARTIVALAVPVFIGSTVNQINTFVDKTLASGLVPGSVSALNYGFLLVNMVSALTVTIIVTIVYPRLTKAQAAGQTEAFNRAATTGFNIVWIIALPCTLGAVLYSQPAIRLVYQRGAFDQASTQLTSGAFTYYALGLTCVALNALLVKLFYARQDVRTPVVCGVAAALTNIALNLLLVGPLAHRGLALATSLAALVNTGLLLYFLRRRHTGVEAVESRVKLARILAAALFSVALPYLVYRALPLPAGGGSSLFLLAAVAASAGLYLLALRLLKVEELELLTPGR